MSLRNHAKYCLTETIVLQDVVIPIDPEIPFSQAALVGCGVMTGVGAALNTANVQPGKSVAVFGCGGVGLNVIQGAAIAGAEPIIAVDILDNKLEMGKLFGATHTVNSAQVDPVEAIQEMTVIFLTQLQPSSSYPIRRQLRVLTYQALVD